MAIHDTADDHDVVVFALPIRFYSAFDVGAGWFVLIFHSWSVSLAITRF